MLVDVVGRGESCDVGDCSQGGRRGQEKRARRRMLDVVWFKSLLRCIYTFLHICYTDNPLFVFMVVAM